MKLLFATTQAIILGNACVKSETPPFAEPSDLEVLEIFYQAELDQANAPLDLLEKSYREQLEKVMAQFKESGNLNGVLEVKSALEELDNRKPFTGQSQSAVDQIRADYITRKNAFEIEVDKKIAEAKSQHLSAMKKTVSDLTKAGKIEEAQTVQSVVEKLESAPAEPRTPGSKSDAQSTTWKQIALKEFPDLSDPKSKLSVAVRNRQREIRSMNPSYFRDPQWPLLLAKECDAILRTDASRLNSLKFSTKQQRSAIGGKADIRYKTGKLTVAWGDRLGEWIDLKNTGDATQDSVLGGLYHIQYLRGKLRVAWGDSTGNWIDLTTMSDTIQESVIGGMSHIQYQNGKLRVAFGPEKQGEWIDIIDER